MCDLYAIKFQQAGTDLYLTLMESSISQTDDIAAATKFYSKAMAYKSWEKYMQAVKQQMGVYYDLDYYLKSLRASMSLVAIKQAYPRGHFIYV